MGFFSWASSLFQKNNPSASEMLNGMLGSQNEVQKKIVEQLLNMSEGITMHALLNVNGSSDDLCSLSNHEKGTWPWFDIPVNPSGKPTEYSNLWFHLELQTITKDFSVIPEGYALVIVSVTDDWMTYVHAS